MHFDTLVVGGSFSGLVAALRAADAGTVGIIDKRKTPGSPVNTTGAIPIAWLKKMDLIPPKRCVAAETFGMQLVSPDGTEIEFSKSTPDGYILYPEVYTEWLVERAIEKGCKYMSGVQMTSIMRNGDASKVAGIHTTEGDITAKYIIGADGHGSNLGKAVGLTEPLAPEDCWSGLEYVVENTGHQNQKLFKLWFGHQVAPGGYAWSFPEGEKHLKIGVGIPLSVGKPPKQFLEEFRTLHPEYSGKILRRQGGAIPAAAPVSSLVHGNVMVVGDAGHFCSSLHGGGIWFGMWSGRLAGDAIVAGDINSYDPMWKEALGGVLKRHYKLKSWFYGMSDSDLNRLFHMLKTYQTTMANPDKEFSSAVLHVIKKDPIFVMKAAAGWTKVGLLTDAVHRVVSPKFRLA